MRFQGTARCAAIVGFVLILATAGGAARAAILHGTFSGVMTGGFDFHNTFGAGNDLSGVAITGHLYLDTAAAPAGAPAGSLTNLYENFTGAPWLWGSFTINSVTRNVGPDFRTYTAISSADFGATGDFLTFDANADVIDSQPNQETLMRSALSLSLFDLDDIIVPGKDLPGAGFSWVPDNPSDFGTGSIQAFDQREFLPNGPLETFTTVLGDFNLTAVTFQVVNAPPALPLFATGLAALAVLGVARVRHGAARPASRPKALA